MADSAASAATLLRCSAALGVSPAALIVQCAGADMVQFIAGQPSSSPFSVAQQAKQAFSELDVAVHGWLEQVQRLLAPSVPGAAPPADPRRAPAAPPPTAHESVQLPGLKRPPSSLWLALAHELVLRDLFKGDAEREPTLWKRIESLLASLMVHSFAQVEFATLVGSLCAASDEAAARLARDGAVRQVCLFVTHEASLYVAGSAAWVALIDAAIACASAKEAYQLNHAELEGVAQKATAAAEKLPHVAVAARRLETILAMQKAAKALETAEGIDLVESIIAFVAVAETATALNTHDGVLAVRLVASYGIVARLSSYVVNKKNKKRLKASVELVNMLMSTSAGRIFAALESTGAFFLV